MAKRKDALDFSHPMAWADHLAPSFSAQRGRWGLIRVFPWTTEAEVRQQFRSIHKKIGRTKRTTSLDALRWIAKHSSKSPGRDASYREILEAAGGDYKALVADFQKRGFDRMEAKKKAVDLARLPMGRLRKELEREQQELRTPVHVDRLQSLLTELVRRNLQTNKLARDIGWSTEPGKVPRHLADDIVEALTD